MVENKIVLKVDSLSVTNNDYTILDNISFQINEGEMMAIIGPNGAGKSTLLKTLANIANAVTIKGDFKWHVEQNKIAYIFDKGMVEKNFPITVLDFLASGPWSTKVLFSNSLHVSIEKIKQKLDFVGISEAVLSNALSNLSDGQLQRVIFARVLLQDPKVLVLDEPFSNVDHPTAVQLLAGLRKLCDEKGIVVIQVVHDYYSLHNYFTKAILLANKLIAAGDINSLVDYKNFCMICDSHRDNKN